MYYGTKVKLRGLELSDLDNIMKYWNDLELKYFLSTLLPNSRQEEEEWIKNTWKLRNSGRGYIFAIETHDSKWLGTCGLHAVDTLNRSSNLGIAIHRKDQWGKGYGTDAIITLCAIGFNILNLNRIELEYFEGNIRGVKVYRKAGFKDIGKRRQVRFMNGNYHDSNLMDMLKIEFTLKYPEFNLLNKDK